MSSPARTTLDLEKLRTRRIIATAALTALAVAFLLLKDTSAQVSSTLPAAEPSYQAATTIPSDPAEAQTATARPVRPGEE